MKPLSVKSLILPRLKKKGGLPCDGSSYPITQYPELYEFLKGAAVNDTSSKYGSPFCESTVQKYHGTCSASTFAVPDYRGYFLRVAGMWRSGDSTSWNANFTSNKQSGRVTSINTQQNEQLPNITERFSGVGQYYSSGTDIKNVVGGAFYRWNTANAPDEGAKVANNDGQRDDIFGFEASRSNSIYSGSHVIPANYSVYAYIYAGRVVK